MGRMLNGLESSSPGEASCRKRSMLDSRCGSMKRLSHLQPFIRWSEFGTYPFHPMRVTCFTSVGSRLSMFVISSSLSSLCTGTHSPEEKKNDDYMCRERTWSEVFSCLRIFGEDLRNEWGNFLKPSDILYMDSGRDVGFRMGKQTQGALHPFRWSIIIRSLLFSFSISFTAITALES